MGMHQSLDVNHLSRLSVWRSWHFSLMLLAVAVLAAVSVMIGVGDLSWQRLISWQEGNDSALLLMASRIPRTIALILSGAALSIVGLIMQMIARNRFVEPSTAGTAESASLGLLMATLIAPQMALGAKMLVATAFALAGTLLFLLILRRIPLRSTLVVPLVGLMLAGIIDSVATFLAYRNDLLQSLGAWSTGDFSSVLKGRYELLWIAFVLAVTAYIAADRFTVAGLGETFSTNLGVNYARVIAMGLLLVATVTAVIVSTVGIIPFLGLIVPNLVSMIVGDNARRAIPWVAVSGAGFVLLCDVIGRLVRYPYEIPAGTIAGVIGCVIFLSLVLRPGARHG
ncbi:iron chelate uptake ABC transporter family permease subunit [Pseudomonas cichorii]|uniref:ABC transporter permease n=1 Tax=Pseudomonas cichorii TaxID=36746 RepID=UPI0018E5C219|nr:iron chelate uptake ABC transporter family permease subunit [Pseudomonas cichorii]MBI6854250.1 iron chelate uptake ABC transporter family permease subunit [Pseudomonas cichorii]